MMLRWLLACTGLFFASEAYAQRVAGPEVVALPEQLSQSSSQTFQPDAPFTVEKKAGTVYWTQALWNKKAGGIHHARIRQTAAGPVTEWVKSQPELFRGSNVPRDGVLWIVNSYSAEAGTLAFVHVENAEGTGSPGSSGKSRLGLAWSADKGETYQYLGPIIVPHGDPNPFNVQGAPYIVLDGYFYVYYHDTSGLTVARARVRDVLRAAQRGETTEWLKYAGAERGFAEAGRGGASQRIGIDGISHTDAACSTSDGACYMVLTRMNWKGGDTWVNLYKTRDGVRWQFAKTVHRLPASQVKHGFQYATIVAHDHSDNAEVDRRFYVYCFFDHQDSGRKLYRWTLDLTE